MTREDAKKLLDAVGAGREVGGPEWLAAIVLALIAENQPATGDDIAPIVQTFVGLYVRRTTVTKFARLVRDLRAAQNQYFRTKSPDWLAKSKGLEKAVDDWVAAALQVQPQRQLFETTPHKEPYR